MSQLKKLILITFAVTAAVCSSASAATIGGVAPSTGGFDCTNADCTYVQVGTHPGAPSYTVPLNGVATSFSVRLGTAVFLGDSLRFYTFEPGSAPTKFVPSADSGPIVVTGSPATQVLTLPIRQTVRAGQFLGLGLDLSGTTFGRFAPSGATTQDDLREFNGFPTLGQEVPQIASSLGQHMNMSAVIEPDADHDGYGDESQDGCPTDRSDQGPCTAPAISDFKFSLNKFAVENAGAVLQPAATAQGTTVIITLSKAARVSFELSRRTVGRKVGSACKKQTRKNRKKKKCTRYLKPYKFTRDLPQGTSNLGFSGRIKVGEKTVSLPVGKYRATAAPFSVSANLAGPIATSSFTVVAPK